MAQHDYVIDNQSFPATRTDINNVLLAISSTNSGTSAPSTTYANQLWYDTTNNKLYIRNEDNDAWIPLFLLDQSNDKAGTLATEIDIEDASGTNAAGTALTVKGGAGTGTGAGGSIIFQTADGGSSGSSVNAHATRVTITDDGKVGVGTASPTDVFEVNGGTLNGTTYITVTNNNSDQFISMGINANVGEIAVDDGDVMTFGHYDNFSAKTYTERMRIDSSGNLLVGMTSGIGTFTNAGVGISSSSNYIHAIRDGNIPLFVGRKTSDGEIIRFYKDGTNVGSIGAVSSRPYISTPYASESGLRFDSAYIAPCTTTGGGRDNAIDLGASGARFDDIYATNGTIQTSDANEKQDITSLTSDEITAAKAISKLFKTFKWKSKVTSKGDNARTHTGVIAQEVQSAMTDAGLDATKYAFWCSDTWWEHDVEVPAVEAVEAQDAVLDDDGNIVTEAVEAVEAQDAYTRTDTYETAEEAPEGATERTRLGIRYPELLAFIGAATEQRLVDIETRLTALEG